MTALPIIVVFCALGFVTAYFIAPRSKVAAGGAALSFALFAAFCVFGYLASGEPGVNTVPWRIGYSFAFLASVFGIFKSGRSLLRSTRASS